MRFDIDETEWQQLMETIEQLRNENKVLKKEISNIVRIYKLDFYRALNAKVKALEEKGENIKANSELITDLLYKTNSNKKNLDDLKEWKEKFMKGIGRIFSKLFRFRHKDKYKLDHLWNSYESMLKEGIDKEAKVMLDFFNNEIENEKKIEALEKKIDEKYVSSYLKKGFENIKKLFYAFFDERDKKLRERIDPLESAFLKMFNAFSQKYADGWSEDTLYVKLVEIEYELKKQLEKE